MPSHARLIHSDIHCYIILYMSINLGKDLSTTTVDFLSALENHIFTLNLAGPQAFHGLIPLHCSTLTISPSTLFPHSLSPVSCRCVFSLGPDPTPPILLASSSFLYVYIPIFLAFCKTHLVFSGFQGYIPDFLVFTGIRCFTTTHFPAS